MKRPSIAWAIVLSLVATLAATTSPVATAAPVVAPAAVAAQIDLTNPTAGINDPLASMPVLDRNCTAGQTDVNTATTAQLMAAFHIDADTAGRMIAGREWLKATDTISVPGVPSSSYQYIRANGCATPITLPPVPVNQCKSGSSALDLQVATQSQLMKIAGLSKTTSLSLIAARPLPDNLHQVAAPVVAGLSDSKITELLTSGKVCITPPPFTHLGNTWRWIGHEHGAVVSAHTQETYALYVPPGVVAGDGAYGTVTVLPIETHSMPAMSAHIYGTWSGELAAEIPNDGGGIDAGNQPIGFHWAADELRLSFGRNGIAVNRSGLTSVFPVMSLTDLGVSEMPWDTLPSDSTLSDGFIYREGLSSRDQPLSSLMRDNTSADSNRISGISIAQQSQPTEQPSTGPRLCLTAVGLARTWGAPPEGIGCAVEYTGASASWTLANGHEDLVFTTKLRAPATYVAGSFYSDWLSTWFLGDPMNPYGTLEPVLLPSSSVQISLDEGAGQSTLTIAPSGERTWTWFAVRQLTDLVQLMEAAGQLLPGTLSENQSCATQLAMNMATGSPDPASACFGAAFDAWSSRYAPTSKSKRLLKVVAMVGKEVAGKVLLAYEAFTVRNKLNSAVPSYMTIQVLRPSPTGGGGTTGMPSGFMIRDNQGHAYLVTDADAKIHAIATGETYVCLSKHYAIDWAVDAAKLSDYKAKYAQGDDALCDESVPESRLVTSENAPDLFGVLRIEAGPESWIIQGGYRWPIPTGTEFNCWVNPQYRANMEVDVYDFVTRAQLETWPVGPGTISNCGDPEHPQF